MTNDETRMTNGFHFFVVVMLAAVLAGCAQTKRLNAQPLPITERAISEFPKAPSVKAHAPTYATGDELLVAVNARMKEMHRAVFTLDELTVWLATQAGLTRSESDGTLQPRVANFLEHLAAKKKFKFPVGLMSYSSDDLPLTDDIHSDKRLRLPSHCVLQVAIYNVPYGSKDADGQPLKVVWSAIPVATALEP